MQTINCGGRLLDLRVSRVMGILNVSPDSFYDGGRYMVESAILRQVEKMLVDGADIIDVGGMSSRPGATIISEEDEIGRVLPTVKAILKLFPECILSVDTIRSEVARSAVGEGVGMINDISAGEMDERMFPTVAELSVPYVLMHIRGIPKTMQDDPEYKDVTLEILDYLIAKVGRLRELGVKDIVIDPGFGFGKTVGHNFELLGSLDVLGILGLPVLVGLSRKSMIHKTLGVTAGEALNGTTALHVVALERGAKILRVHDVKEAKEVIRLFEQLEATRPKK